VTAAAERPERVAGAVISLLAVHGRLGRLLALRDQLKQLALREARVIVFLEDRRGIKQNMVGLYTSLSRIVSAGCTVIGGIKIMIHVFPHIVIL